ncbi:uncharacterized protein HD556DRAFT_1440487 [Suillus plorans]|uniref:Uncharacterized protein n=1 Tax=Suillus plorans TaxID=116603 RepID=A0A9P7J0I9_9AGAM|nr:uncharacterized protein HD556DRAFT_1440487 [Suillus plorans]KAG1798150.1 hypothetical protein HD556DRAFT_1440487 [Suillus plorans]
MFWSPFTVSQFDEIVLANETTVVTPLGGYQYVPIETVEPGNDRSLEPWTDCLVVVNASFNVAQYEAYSPVFMTATMAVVYGV